MDIHLVNKRLKDYYGKDLLGQPIYRVIWSADEREKRFGTFRDYISGTDVLIREVTEVREVLKYPFINPPSYVLEKLFFNQHNTEILDNSTLAPQTCTYEPIWTFGNTNGRAKPVIWRAVELILTSLNNPQKLTPSQMDDKEKEQAYKDEKLMMELMEEYIPNDSLHSAIKDGDAVILDSTKVMK